MLRKNLLVAGLLCISSSAMAVSLQNSDGRTHNVKIKSSSSTASGSISSGVVRPNVCSSCTIIVEGVGSVDASGSDKVMIKGGKVYKK